MRSEAGKIQAPWVPGPRSTNISQKRSATHPDRDWINDVITDLSEWLETTSFSPTSQITGGGAIAVAERMFSELHGSRPTLLMPSATYGMRATLAAFGVTAGCEVLIPALDWPSTYAAVLSLGAIPVPVAVDHDTLTIDPTSAAACMTKRTRAAVACSLHGIPADIPALRAVLGDNVPIIGDAGQALGSTLDGKAVGDFADATVYSLGPGKSLSVGEAGIVVFQDWQSHDAVLRQTGHPVRQIIGGIEVPEFGGLAIRPHPLAAVLLVQQLRRWDPAQDREYTKTLALEIAGLTDVRILGRDPRRETAARSVPVSAHQRPPAPTKDLIFSPSGAQNIFAIHAGVAARDLAHEATYIVTRRSHRKQTAGGREP